jgi:hypothetical protein
MLGPYEAAFKGGTFIAMESNETSRDQTIRHSTQVVADSLNDIQCELPQFLRLTESLLAVSHRKMKRFNALSETMVCWARDVTLRANDQT